MVQVTHVTRVSCVARTLLSAALDYPETTKPETRDPTWFYLGAGSG
jgi:hypothetical protein